MLATEFQDFIWSAAQEHLTRDPSLPEHAVDMRPLVFSIFGDLAHESGAVDSVPTRAFYKSMRKPDAEKTRDTLLKIATAAEMFRRSMRSLGEQGRAMLRAEFESARGQPRTTLLTLELSFFSLQENAHQKDEYPHLVKAARRAAKLFEPRSHLGKKADQRLNGIADRIAYFFAAYTGGPPSITSRASSYSRFGAEIFTKLGYRHSHPSVFKNAAARYRRNPLRSESKKFSPNI